MKFGADPGAPEARGRGAANGVDLGMTSNARFRSVLLASLPEGVPIPTDTQIDLMFAWHQAVVDANQRFNLTRITDPAEAAVKHFADSLAVLGWCSTMGVGASEASRRVHPGGPQDAMADAARTTRMERGDDECSRVPGTAGVNPAARSSVRVLDVGTGAGFPAAPLAIMRPEWRVTAIDSTGKKARFVAETASRLGLANLTALHARAGLWKPPELFDLLLFKAVGSMADCLVESCGLARRGGWMLHFKTGEVSADESTRAEKAALSLGLCSAASYRYSLMLGDDRMQRALMVFARE